MLADRAPRLTAVEIDGELAAMLTDRFSSRPSVDIVAGGAFVATDSLAPPELEAHHEGDTYNPVDPDGLHDRLSRAGFESIEVRTNPFGWTARARRAASPR